MLSQQLKILFYVPCNVLQFIADLRKLPLDANSNLIRFLGLQGTLCCIYMLSLGKVLLWVTLLHMHVVLHPRGPLCWVLWALLFPKSHHMALGGRAVWPESVCLCIGQWFRREWLQIPCFAFIHGGLWGKAVCSFPSCSNGEYRGFGLRIRHQKFGNMGESSNITSCYEHEPSWAISPQNNSHLRVKYSPK